MQTYQTHQESSFTAHQELSYFYLFKDNSWKVWGYRNQRNIYLMAVYSKELNFIYRESDILPASLQQHLMNLFISLCCFQVAWEITNNSQNLSENFLELKIW